MSTSFLHNSSGLTRDKTVMLRRVVTAAAAVALVAAGLTTSVPVVEPERLRFVGDVVCGDEAGQSQRATTFDAPCLAPEDAGVVEDASPGAVEIPVEEEDPAPETVPLEAATVEKMMVGTATLAPTETLKQADDLPVWIEADNADTASGSGGTAGKRADVEVEVVADDRAEKARDRARAWGPVVRVAPEAAGGSEEREPAAEGPAAEPLKVAMDVSAYSDSNATAGGGWASRLRLVAYPACVLTTPKKKACQSSTWLDTTRDRKGRLVATLPGELLSKEVPIASSQERSDTPDTSPDEDASQPGPEQSQAPEPEESQSAESDAEPVEPYEATLRSTTSGVVLMAESTPTGADGDWAATSLGTAASWSGGGSSGSFTWSYPLQTPPVASGMEPGLGLTYDSGAVDGVIGSSNVQASWVGLGWDLSPGFIERTYAPCAEDQADHNGGVANNKDRDTGDLCWRGESLNLSLSGHAGEVVKDPSGGTGDFRLRTDDGSVITRLGVKGGQFERFQVTTTDGTRYLFGQTDADTGANSSLRVPVYGNHSGEPGHAATFGASGQDTVWRWNLTQVTDPVGNTVTYHWAKETNRYRANQNIRAVPDEERGGTATGYDRAGYLTKVTYGTKTGDTGAAPARVLFDVAERCRSSYDCSPGSGNTLNENNANQWPDVPFDMVCNSGDCDLQSQFSPTFFTTKQLTRVRTQTFTGSGPDDGFDPVDEWTLAYAFPKKQDPRDQVTLWLSSITHRAGATNPGAGTLAGKVLFRSNPLKNRVDTSSDNLPPMYRPRIATIVDELGAVLGVTYSPPACKIDGAFPDPATNTQRCFPDEAHYDAAPEESHWFYKYVVTAVSQDPGIGSHVLTSYSYGDTDSDGASDGAWARSDDPLALDRKKRWNQWRGYAKVTSRVGDASADGTGHPRTKTVTTFDRGMGSDGTGLDPDARARAGMPTSTTTYAGETIVSKQTTSYDVDPAVAGQTGNRDPRRVLTTATLTASPRASADGGGNQYVKVTMEYDSLGRVVRRDDHAYTKASDTATADTTDRTCLYTTYPGSVANGLSSYPAQSRKSEGACAAEPPAAADLLEGTQWAYDGGGVGQAPTRGLVTTTKALMNDTWQTTAATTYDANGRVKTVTDAAGAATSITYTPESGGAPTKVVSTSPDPDGAGPLVRHQTTTVNDARWGLPTRVTDPAGGATTANYDDLGRLLSVKLAGNTSSVPDLAYTYHLRGTGGAKINAITTKTLVGGGAGSAPGQLTSTALFDSLARQVQTQTETRWTDEKNEVAKGRVIATTNYDSAGRVSQADNQVLAAGLPTTTFVDPVDEAPESITTTYDGASRPLTQTTNWVGTDADPVTRYSYDGNLTHTNPPDGGVATTVVSDARGRAREQWKHTDSGANSDAADGTKVVTRYGYTPTGLLETVKDEKDNTWSYTYDELGHRLTTSDPDAGDSSTVYDELGRAVDSVDANGTKLHTTYDAMGRQILLEEIAGDGTREKLADWVYDTVQTGQLTSTTRFRDGAALYTQAIDAYNVAGQPTDSRVTLAATSGLVPAEVAGTYRTKQSYRLDGQVAATSYFPITPTGATKPVLPAEQVVYDYDDLGRAIRMGGSMGQYVIATAYSAYDQLDQLALGNTYGYMSWQSYRYQPGSGRLSEQQLDRQTRPELDQLLTYAYDVAGNLTSVRTDKQAAGAAAPSWQETECYKYDGLNRLKAAWSGTAQTCGSSAPGTGEVPAGHGFAQEWTFEDATNNRLTDTYTTSKGVTKATYSYPADGSAGGPAHAPGTVTVDTVTGAADAALTGIEGTYTYSAAGGLLDRPVAGDVQRLEWDAEHRLAGVDPAGETASSQAAVYDTAGARVLRRVTEPGAASVTTAYLPGGVELVHDSAKDTGAGLQAGEVTARRDYVFAGQLIATRTGVNPKDVTTWSVDAQGTPEYALGNAEAAAASAGDASVPQRRQLPFGADRGSAPVEAAFPGDKGFVGSTRDEGVDLLHVGARPYDPVLGLFATTDPLVDLSDPASLNAYSYANQNPIGFSDPTGLAAACILEGTCGASSKGTPQAKSDGTFNVNPFDDGYVGGVSPEIKPVVNPPREVYEQATAVANGYGDGKRPDKLFPHQGHTLDADQVIAAYLGQRPELWGDEFETALKFLVFDPSACNGGSAAACTFEIVTMIPPAKVLKGGKHADDIIDAVGDAGKKNPIKNAANGVGKSCKFNSFSADTPVLMGDGSKKQLKDLKVGDWVMAQNPITGIKGPRQITAVWVHKDALYDLEIDGRRIITTEDHPFWSVTEQKWEKAENLTIGELVLTAGGRTTRVTESVDFASRRIAAAYNLTVADLHTYFVGPGNGILVHNDNGSGGFNWDDAWADLEWEADGTADDDGYHAPRGNQAENKQATDARRTIERNIGRKLTEGEWRQVHDEITGRGLDYHGIVETGMGKFGGC